MQNRLIFISTGVFLTLSISACSSGSPTGVEYQTLAQADGQVLTGSGLTDVVSFDASTRILTFNGASGKVSKDGRTALLSDGTKLSLTRDGASYAVAYAASGPSSGFGAYGIQTVGSDMPMSGRANYSGATTTIVTDESGLYDLKGDATMSVNFADGRADLTLNDLNGSQATGVRDPKDVNDFGAILIADIELDGARLLGGNASISSSYVSELSSNSEANVLGSFYGPRGDEAAGEFSIEDTNAGSTNIVGNFIVD